MCLTISTDHRKHNEWGYVWPEAIADRDYLVFKRMRVYKTPPKIWVTPYRGKTIRPGNQSPVKLRRCGRTVYEGWHAYRTLEQAIKVMKEGEVIVRAIIPKGSTLYYGTYNQVVSSHMKITATILHKWDALERI